MKKLSVRIVGIEIEGFKNVSHGELILNNKQKNHQSSVLGLYGQNGSGKTSLIDALELLKFVLCGNIVPSAYSDYINVDSECAKLKYIFELKEEENSCNVIYEFSIKKEYKNIINNIPINNNIMSLPENSYHTVIFNEILCCSYNCSGLKCKMMPIINTMCEDVFLPKTKYKILIGNSKKDYNDLMISKKIAETTSRSFIFSSEFLSKVRQYVSKDGNIEREIYSNILEGLVYFGNCELFIINTTNSGIISMDAQPLVFKYDEENKISIGQMMIPLGEPIVIPSTALDVINKIINDMNIVLEQIVPELRIKVEKLGETLLADNKYGTKIELVSCKNSKEIPLKYESEGIKKIISILQLLIVVYNNKSMTVAVDELDSGIFEYLLGEILKIISEKGKGQLIFTSHNLRPLETLDKSFIAFTTTDKNNRYITLKNVKETNNLRDVYYRNIVLGDDSEKLYNSTNNSEIALSFRKAGAKHG